MATILSNGSRIWRYNNLILRSPIYKKLSLTPSGCAYYDVGSDFVQSLPTRDFFVTNRGIYAIASGHDCRQAYLGYKYPTPSDYRFRNNTAWGSLPDTGTMWYNGNWSPAFGAVGGAAFIRVAAYKFSIPKKYRNANISNISIETGDIGTMMICGSPQSSITSRVSDRYPQQAWNIATNILPSDSNLRSRSMNLKFGAWSESQVTNGFPPTMYNNAQMESTLNLTDTDANNYNTTTGVSPNIPLWITLPSGTVRYNDGVVPDAPNRPHVQAHAANANFIQAVKNNSSNFYITPMFNVGDSRRGDTTVTSADGPYYYLGQSSTAYYKMWWCCQRFWIRKIDVTVQIGEA